MSLEAVNLGFRYRGGPWLFRGFHLRVEPGEVVGLLGPSGSGKTTLARLLAGYEQPLEGEVRWRGQPFPSSGYYPAQLVWQHPEQAVNPRWRLSETLNEGGSPDPELVEALGIQSDWLRRWPHELSGGELQRICVARALRPKTEYLIADEMTTMLDAIAQAQIWRAVLNYAKPRDIGILVISHERALVQRLCDRAVDLKQFVNESGSESRRFIKK